MSEKYDNKFTRFLNGKGFYAVLALCLAGAGTAAYIAMESAAQKADQKNAASQSDISIASEWSFPPSEETAGKQEGVKKPFSQPFSSSSKPQQSPKQQPEPPAESKPSEQPASLLKPSWSLPIEGEVFTPYSNGELIKNETLGDWRTHNGIDIEAAEGSVVKSACKGKVTRVTDDPLWGFVVEVSHPGDITARYCGLNKNLSVKEGDELKGGQVIGLVGTIPAESLMPSHLHFECLKGEEFIDPLSVIK